MVLYILGIFGGDAVIMLIALLKWRFVYDWSVLFTVVATLLAMIGVIAIDGIFATFIRRALPEKWFDHNATFHNASKKECSFYEHLGIKWWKDHVLELGMFTNFSKKKVEDPNSIEYLDRFILENNYGAIIHITTAFLGFLLLIPYPAAARVHIALPAVIINCILNLLPFMILRYNTNRIQRVRAVLEKKLARSKSENKPTEE